MEKYLINGQAVRLIREVEGGFLYQNVFFDPDYEDGYIDDSSIFFADKLFDNPPVEKYHQEVKDLQVQIGHLKEEMDSIRQLKRKERSLLTEIKNRDFVQCLVDFMNGDFNFVLFLPEMELRTKDSVYISPFVKMINSKGHGYSLYILRNENYEDYYDIPIMVFKTIESAKDYAKEKLINELRYNTEKSNYSWRSDVIKSWFRNIHRTCGLQEDPELIELYQIKYNEAKNKEDADKKDKIRKEIEEKEKILEQLNK